MQKTSREVLLYGEKRGLFGRLVKKFVASLTVKNGKLVVDAINKDVGRELCSAYDEWWEEHKTVSIHTGRDFVDKEGRQVHQTIAVHQKPEDKEYLTAVAENIFDGEVFGGYEIWGFRVMEDGKKVMDVGVVKIEKDVELARQKLR